jgi:hypothetical protein
MLMVFSATFSGLDQIIDIHITIYYAWFMVLNVTFNNILAIWWRTVFFVEETEYPGKTTDLPQVTGKLYSHSCILYTSPEQNSNSQC